MLRVNVMVSFVIDVNITLGFLMYFFVQSSMDDDDSELIELSCKEMQVAT